MLGKIREKLVGKPTESPLLFTPPGVLTAPATSQDPFGPLIKKRSTLPNDSMSSLQVTMQPVLFSLKESECRLLDHSGTSIASMRTTTTGWTHLASVLAGMLSFVGMNFLLRKVPFDQKFQLVINEAVTRMMAPGEDYTLSREYASLAQKFKTRLAAITSISVTVSFVINLTIYLRKPIYQFRDGKGNIQLLARHERDRKSILIEYTKVKNEENTDLKFIMKLNIITNTWELYSDVNKSHTKPVFLLPATWKRGDSFYTDRKDFTIDITSITKYSLKIFDTRYVMPLTNASERQYLQFKEHNDVPRDVLAFLCYIARTANTMPTDFLIYTSCLAAFTFLAVKLTGDNRDFNGFLREAYANAKNNEILDEFKAMAKNLWEEGAIDSLKHLEDYKVTAQGIKQASNRLAYRFGRDAADSAEQKAWHMSTTLYNQLYGPTPDIELTLKERLDACHGDVACMASTMKDYNLRENRKEVIGKMRILGKSFQWSHKEKKALNANAKKNKELWAAAQKKELAADGLD